MVLLSLVFDLGLVFCLLAGIIFVFVFEKACEGPACRTERDSVCGLSPCVCVSVCATYASLSLSNGDFYFSSFPLRISTMTSVTKRERERDRGIAHIDMLVAKEKE